MGTSENLFTEFERNLLSSNNQLGVSMLLILAWMASADGQVDASERAQFQEIMRQSKTAISADYLFRVAIQRDSQALQLACEILREEITAERAPLLVQLSIGMATADGFISMEEVHIIHLVADLVGISKTGLDDIFVELTGRPCPDFVDLSRKSSWFTDNDRSRTNQQGKKERSRSHSQSSGSFHQGTSPREEICLGILGLDPGASKEQIKKSYRRLAQIHHPDRFSSLGDEAVAAATAHFQKINEAYEYLMSNA